ncbi:hypothetical protein IHC92_20820 [Photobacterium damselae subsp. damselae]|uniref:hypothetical protein n=1 Tax=Photobacterium damselae TaxID=38293 RepID=UPI001F205839|nr:hypothetical protein [Photobacterium damselae]UKA23398.1 hypothetical protein IHC92_20820 [Photobacterium damselae subsp. damselae]
MANIPSNFFEGFNLYALQYPIVGGICYLLVSSTIFLSPILAYAAFRTKKDNRQVESALGQVESALDKES